MQATPQAKDKVKAAIQALIPEGMSSFEGLLDLYLLNMTDEQAEQLAGELESCNGPDGVNLERLQEIGLGYGVTQADVESYAAGQAATNSR